MYRLNEMFREDIELQTMIEDTDLVDDADDIMLCAMEDRYEDNNPHLFTEAETNEDNLTIDEEREIFMAMLAGDDEADDIIAGEVEDEMIDSVLDDEAYEGRF